MGIGILRRFYQYPLLENELNLTVGELIVDNYWNLDNLSLDFPECILERIYAMPIAYHMDDASFYLFVDSDKFYLSEVYN